jgi:hypothetical protein
MRQFAETPLQFIKKNTTKLGTLLQAGSHIAQCLTVTGRW